MDGEDMTVKARMLKLLEQHENELISGEAAAAELNCTRAAIWKAVKSLREEGYTIEAGPNKGYVLCGGSRLSEEGIRLYLNHPDASVKIYRELDSTNRAAKEAAFSGEAGHGALILARQQKNGRGRRGRSFYSPENAGLYMSIVLRPERTLKEGLLITTAAATAVYRAVKKICGIDLGIKWVNDLYLHDKKVCGILTEAVTDFESGNIEFAVVGIGLNLYIPEDGFPEEIQGTAGALFGGRKEAEHINCSLLVAEIVNQLLMEAETPELSREYTENNIIPGNMIVITDGTRTREAYAKTIASDGRLLVREQDGSETLLSYGEVSVRRKPEEDQSN
ncbi:biotin--[acetyl-CoA-carboxylase] ligase [Blautia schinkii]|uniref:biotin--[acetyl-CoA-carboxylase] ligase n=2 Tax=Blautia schinkii TaxID=180164 RepID=UPI002ED54C56